MNAFTPAETVHRLVKQAIDSGAAASLEEAQALFRGYRVGIILADGMRSSPTDQAALLTAVALGRRVFLGGVSVAGSLDTPLLVPLPFTGNLRSAVEALGGQPTADALDDRPCIFIGGPCQLRGPGFRIRTVYAGWRGGVVPAHVPFLTGESGTVPLSVMLAAALAISETFFHVQGSTPAAGRRRVGLSLWEPARADWLSPDPEAPPLKYLPSHLWLIGLGHLGQAFLWGLGLLPYTQQAPAALVLQDTDVITPSTPSTSVLSEPTLVGTKKTRAMATWAERRGFATAIVERRFDSLFRRAEEDPAIALCGLDNALGRRALDTAGFPLVVEAGLGRGHRDFRTIRLHTLPGTRTAAEIWHAAANAEDLTGRAAYQKLLRDGRLDQCGVTLLAGKAVGAPFVGAIAATLGIAEILRLLHGGRLSQLVDLDLQTLDHRIVVRQSLDFGSFNPGYVPVTTAG
jgi:hypothetical protein